MYQNFLYLTFQYNSLEDTCLYLVSPIHVLEAENTCHAQCLATNLSVNFRWGDQNQNNFTLYEVMNTDSQTCSSLMFLLVVETV